MPARDSFCTECYRRTALGSQCSCGEAAVPVILGGLGGAPAFIGHLRIVDQTPSPWRILEEADLGPRLFPAQSPDGHVCCFRHGGRTVWVWQESIEVLPPPGSRPTLSGRFAALSRVLPATRALLIDAPQRSPLFGALYARTRGAAPSPPELMDVVDRLNWLLSCCAHRMGAIALFDPSGHSAEEDKARLASLARGFSVFPRREAAIAWLVRGLPPPQWDAGPPAAQAAETPSEKGAAAALSPPRSRTAAVRICDLGGVVGCRLLAWLHMETEAARAAASDAAPLRVPVALPITEKLWAQPTKEGLFCGRVFMRRSTGPLDGEALPPWAGLVTHWWRPERPVSVELAGQAAPECPGALVIGVGPSRLIAERQLATLIQRLWAGSSEVAAAILCHEAADTKLRGWVREEFRGVSEFPGSPEGAKRALARALRIASELAGS